MAVRARWRSRVGAVHGRELLADRLGTVGFGGLLAGYLSERATGDRAGVGARAGLVGALPVLWMLTDILLATSALTGPAWFVAAGTALVVLMGGVFALLWLAVAALVGAVGGRVGGWLAGVVGPRRPPTRELRRRLRPLVLLP